LRIAYLLFRPNFIHSLEIQNAGYICLRAFSKRKPAATLIVTNWGSDIFWFQKFPKHLKKIKRLLEIADKYSCECKRDVDLAIQFGFTGEVLPIFPNAGGFSSYDLTRSVAPLSERNVIAIKGYHGWVGRAHLALDAIELLADELRHMQVVVYSANQSTIQKSRRVSKRVGIQISAYGIGALSHNQVLDIFATSKIYVGLSMSDGISTSLLESMAMGSIPVQTSSACCDEWFITTGVKVDSLSVEKVAQAILAGLQLAENQANSDFNRQVIRDKASADLVQKLARTFYRD
jgi:glycosyltransferase involved in cell wall biosynthesis